MVQIKSITRTVGTVALVLKYGGVIEDGRRVWSSLDFGLMPLWDSGMLS